MKDKGSLIFVALLIILLLFTHAFSEGEKNIEPGRRAAAYYHSLRAQRTDDPYEAIERIEEAIEIMPDVPILHTELGTLYKVPSSV